MKKHQILEKVGACKEAATWASQYDTAQDAWNNCKRGDWMLWLLGKLSGPRGSDSRKSVVRAACECARLALPQYEARYPDDKRPRTAIETAERHCDGGATLEDVRTAASAAYAASVYADAADAASAASAAYAATAYAYADAASAYANAASAASALAARAKRLAECAEIVRKHFPVAPGGAP